MPPTAEQLREAFRSVPGLTAADAQILRANAFGILVRRFTPENAAKLCATLAAQGYEAEVVDEAALPALPQTRFVQRLDCTAEALLVYDLVGRAVPLAWNDVVMVAAGRVKLMEIVRKVVTDPVVHYDGHGMPHGGEETRAEYKEERNFHLLLEIVTTRPVARISAQADRLNFMALGERKTPRLPDNFTLLTRDILRATPDATVNSGAYYIRENAERFFDYPSKNAFFEEITWLLWRLKQSGVALA